VTISFHLAENQILVTTLYCSIRLYTKVLRISDIPNHNIPTLLLRWLLLTDDFQADHKMSIKRISFLHVSGIYLLKVCI